MTRDVGTQSTPPYLSSSSPSPASTPSIMERPKTRAADSPNSNAKTKSEEEVCTRLIKTLNILLWMSLSEEKNILGHKKLPVF